MKKLGPMSSRFGKSYVERTAARFWSKVDRCGHDDCWPWLGTKKMPNNIGEQYGTFGVSENGNRTEYRAHRLAYMLAVGEVPDGILVMHTCDTPLCVNPNHLELGTNADNMADRDAKGRVAKGEGSGKSKLRAHQVRRIRRSRRSNSELASEYGVHSTTILNIRRGRLWGHLDQQADGE